VGTYVGAAVSSLGLGFAQHFGWRAAALVSGLAGLWGSLLLHRTALGGGEGDKDLNRILACGVRLNPPWATAASWDDAGDGDDAEPESPTRLPLGDRTGDRGGDRSGVAGSSSEERQGLLPPVSSNPFVDEPASPAAAQAAVTTAPKPPTGLAALNAALSDSEGSKARGEKGSLLGALATVGSSPRLALLFGATSCRMGATVAAAAYFPVYFTRAFPAESEHFGAAHALAILVGGGSSCYAGGCLADRWQTSSDPSALAWLPGAGGLLAVPLLLLSLRAANSFAGSMWLLGLQYLAAECWLGPGMTLLQLLMKDEASPHLMSTVVALLLCANTLAASVAPYAIALADDGTASSARLALGWAMALAYGGSALLFALLARALGCPNPAALAVASPPPTQADGGNGGEEFTYTVPSLAAGPGPPRDSTRAGGTVLGGASPRKMWAV
jgi:hypothetical protein